MNNNVIHILGAVTAILLLIFAVFAGSYKKGNLKSHRFLSLFLVVNSIYIFTLLMPSFENIFALNLRWLATISSNCAFLFGPLLYIYTRSITEPNLSIKAIHLFHILLFIIALIIRIMMDRPQYIYLYAILQCQITVYLIMCFIKILNYRKKIKDYYSSLEKLNLTWMLYVVGAFFIMWMIDLVLVILSILGMMNTQSEKYFEFSSLLINFVFAVIIFYKSLNHPEIFSGIPQIGSRKYEYSKLSDNEKSDYLKKFNKYFKQEKPFLNPLLTIKDVASEIGVPAKYLSQVINEKLNKNFYDYVNYYRIEESKKLLLEDHKTSKTVLEILYDSGFNSKSAFNAAFKRQTGTTPTIYRDQKITA